MTRNRKAPKVRAQQDTSITPQKGSSRARRETAKKRETMWHERIILKEKAGQHEQKKEEPVARTTSV